MQNRNLGIDLFRMVSMYMVVVLHTLGHGGVLGAYPLGSAGYEAALFLQIAAYGAVDGFGMISGYVGYSSKYRYSNIVTLWLQVVFWSLLIAIAVYFLVPGSLGLKDLVKSVIPVRSRTYWYFTAYFCLFLFIPILNKAVGALSRGQFKAVLIVLLVVVCAYQTIALFDRLGTESGYSAIWLIILYLFGAYLGKYQPFESQSKARLFVFWVAMVVLTWVVQVLALCLTNRGVEFLSNQDLLKNYISPTVVCGSAALLLLFSRLNISPCFGKFITFFAPMAFGVYLISDNRLFRAQLITDTFAVFSSLPIPVMMLAVLGSALVIYFVCSLLDWVRLSIFKGLKLKQRLSALEQRLIGDLWHQDA